MLRIMNRKGSLTFGQIVMAIIALVVLIVMISIFVNKMNATVTEASSCTTIGGTCQTAQCPAGTLQKYGSFSDCKSPKVCCVSPFGSFGKEDKTDKKVTTKKTSDDKVTKK